MKKEKKKAYEPGKIASGISGALSFVVGLVIFLAFVAIAVLTVYLAVKGGLWIWEQ